MLTATIFLKAGSWDLIISACSTGIHCGMSTSYWNKKDNFFYDVLSLPGRDTFPLAIRSIVGLVPLFAVSIITCDRIDKLNDFKKRMDWFRNYRITNKKYLPSEETSWDKDHLLSLVHKDRL